MIGMFVEAMRSPQLQYSKALSLPEFLAKSSADFLDKDLIFLRGKLDIRVLDQAEQSKY